MNANINNLIDCRLRGVLAELRKQSHIAVYFGEQLPPFDEYIAQLREWIEDVGEYGIAYESIVAALESAPFTLSGKAAVGLLEVGLLFGFKTENDADKHFDRRRTD